MIAEPATQLAWVNTGDGFWRDATGRFDVWFTAALTCWVAVDWECGRKVRRATAEAAMEWCEQRNAIRRAA